MAPVVLLYLNNFAFASYSVHDCIRLNRLIIGEIKDSSKPATKDEAIKKIKEDAKDKGSTSNMLMDNSKRTSLYIFPPNAGKVTLGITSPNADVSIGYSPIIDLDTGNFTDFRYSVNSTKGLYKLIVDKEFVFSQDLSIVLGYRNYDSTRVIPSWWTYAKFLMKYENVPYVKTSDFTASKIASDSAITKHVFETLDVSFNFNFIWNLLTVGVNLGISKQNNYSRLDDRTMYFYSKTIQDSSGVTTASLGSEQSVKVGNYKEVDYSPYSCFDLFIRTFDKIWCPNLHFYGRYNCIGQGSDSFQYYGLGLLFNTNKTNTRHYANLGIRFQTKPFQEYREVSINRLKIEILGSYVFSF